MKKTTKKTPTKKVTAPRPAQKSKPASVAPPPPPPEPSHDKAWYKAADGTRVNMKSKLKRGDTVAGRTVADFEPDGRIIFFKKAEPAPAVVAGPMVAKSTALPFDPDGPTLIRGISVNDPNNEDEAEEVWDSGTSIEKLKAATLWLDLNYKSRNVTVGVELSGPAPRILAALAALTQKNLK